MITCRELAGLLDDLIAGRLPGERRRQARQHLRRCEACAAFLHGYRVSVALARRLPRAALPPRLEERLQALLREKGEGLRSQG